MKYLYLLLLSLFALLSAHSASAQVLDPRFFDYPQNYLDWYTLESEHFQIHYQEGNSRTAQVVSRIAEEVYKPITSLYQHEPNTQVHIILRDRQDYANGAAYFYDNKIEIWVSALDTPLRGTRDWFRNVITHEFTHIVQVQASMKRDRKIPAWYVQWLEYENIRRPDVLYGFPTGIFTMPLLSINMPAWFSEGTAQFMRAGIHYDVWDSHRDMILRTRMLSGTTLPLTQMGNFSTNTSLENETIYNQGYAFSTWMAKEFGEEILGEITRAMAEPGVVRIEEGIKNATGIDGQELFDRFVAEQTVFYKAAVANISMPEADTVQGVGFANFYPTFSSDEQTVGYLTNGARDYYIMQMRMDSLKEENAGSTASLFEAEMGYDDSPKLNVQPHSAHAFDHDHSLCAQSSPILSRVSDAFSFSPDGRYITYSFSKLNARGELYKDLYVFDLKEGKRKKLFNREIPEQLTKSKRIYAPAWHPSKDILAAVQVEDNTLNLVLYDMDKEEASIQSLTNHARSQQIFRPQWHPDGSRIYFAYTDGMAREIRFIDLATNKVHKVIGDGTDDFRDVVVAPEGGYLYYSSDKTGIFNIYRAPLLDDGTIDASKEVQLTNVIGGAFMPDVSMKGELVWSNYEASGYKILKASIDELLAASTSYQPYQSAEEDLQTYRPFNALSELNTYNDSDIAPFNAQAIAIADTGSFRYMLQTRHQESQRTLRAYDETFLKFAWYPVVRFDNYNKPRGANGQLLTSGQFGDLAYNFARDFKFGTYFGSREVTENFSLFGGLLFAPASREATSVGNFFSPTRITEMDRDLFLTAEYRGLPFIKKRWSPTIQINLFNLRRNVDNGLSIAEHPCTACAPDTTTADIAFNIWQADVNLISKINDWNLVQLGVSFAPYQVVTEGFFSREFQDFIPSSSSEYFRATTFTLAYIYDLIVPTKHRDISPLGFRGFFRMNYQPSRLLDNYRIEGGSLIPVYQREENLTLEAFTRYGFPIKGLTTGMLFSRVFSYLNDPRSIFFADYFGGITGMRSYPFFALGGNTTAFSVLSVITPIDSDMDFQIGRFHIDKMYARFFAEAGSGWGANLGYNGALRKGIGAELRVNMTGQYIMPNRFFISGSYGLDQFRLRLDEEFISDEGLREVTYGGEWLIHFGFTFDFDLN